MAVGHGRWRTFWSWFRDLHRGLAPIRLTRGQRRKNKARHSVPPRPLRGFEMLEPRRMMTVTSWYDPSLHTLHVSSDSAYEAVQVGYELSSSAAFAKVTTDGNVAVPIQDAPTGGVVAPPLAADVELIDISISGGHATVDLRNVLGGVFNFRPQTIVHSSSGDDVVYGNGLATTFYTGAGSNILYGAGGTEELYGGSGTNSLYGAGGRLTLHGGSGTNVLYANYNAYTNNSPHDSSTVATLHGGEGTNLLYGDGGTDVLQDGGGANFLYGEGGSESLYGTTGTNYLYGHYQPTFNSAHRASTLLNGGAGLNVLYGDGGYDLLNDWGGTNILYGAGGSEYLMGFTGTNYLYAHASNTIPSANAQLVGGSGVNYFDGRGGPGTNEFWGGGGENTLYGGGGDNILHGGSGANVLFGGGGADVLYGNALANSTLVGGNGGSETLYGAGGQDEFQLGSGNNRYVAPAVRGGGVQINETAGGNSLRLDFSQPGVGDVSLDLDVRDRAQTINGHGLNLSLGSGVVLQDAIRSQSNTVKVVSAGEQISLPSLSTSNAVVAGNVLVNNPATDGTSASDTQSETSMIVFGSSVLVSYNDSHSNVSNGTKFTGYALSTDGGVTFTDKGELPTNASFGDAGDPVIARDNVSGRIYLATLGYTNANSIPVFRSTDGGATFQAPVNSAPGITGGNLDKEWIAVDNFSGAGQGNVYLVVRDFGTTQGIRFFRSTDQGTTWTPSGGTMLTSATTVQGAYVVVGADHSVCAFWFDQSSGTRILMRRSTDQGLTWAAAITVATLNTTGTNGSLGLSFRTNAFPTVTVNPVTGAIYVAYNDKSGTDRGNIYFTQSTNNGATWSTPLKVNDDTTSNDQWQPAIAVKPNGTQVFIGFYDRRNDVANTLIDTYGAIGNINVSTGVITWQANQRITTTSFGVVVGVDPLINTTYMGDYDTAGADNGAFYYVWADNRDASAGRTGNQANVRFAKISTSLVVSSSTPADGAVTNTPLTDFTIVLSEPYDLASVQASDLTVNGTPADSFIQVDSQTLRFTFNTTPNTTQGVQTLAIAAGAITRQGDANPVAPFSATFRYDLTPLQVLSTSPANGSAVTLPLTTLDINLNEAVDPASVGTNDLTLSQGTVTAAQVIGANTVRYTVSGVTNEGSFSINLAAGALTDVYGNPSMAYTGALILDVGTVPFPTPLASANPQGALIYSGSISTNNIGFAGDTDSYTLNLDPNQSLTLLVHPSAAGLQPTVQLYDGANVLLGSVTAAIAGQDVVLQGLGALSGGTYTIVVSGAGVTTGAYSLTATLNAELEREAYFGPANDTLATAQSLDPSFISLGGAASRAAVVGALPAPATGTLFSDGFESGSLGAAWSTYSSDATLGRIQVSGSQTKNSGAFALLMDHNDTAGTTYNLNEAILTVDLSGRTQATLSFAHTSYSDEDDTLATSFTGHSNGDGVSISANGTNWFRIWQAVSGTAGVYSTITVDLAAAASTAGISLGPNFKIKFQQYDNYNLTTDGRGWDDILITMPVAANDDWYSFSLTAGSSASIGLKPAVTGATFNPIQLYDSSGQLLTIGATGAQNVTQTIADFVANSTGAYYVRVSGTTGGTYNLFVVRNAEFDTETNDTIATAQPIQSNSTGGDQRVLGDIGGTSNSILHFNELPAQSVNGLSIDGTTFSFTIDGMASSDATFAAGRIDKDARRLDDAILEGNAAGVLTIHLNSPATHVSFDFSFLKPEEEDEKINSDGTPFVPPGEEEEEGGGLFVQLIDAHGNVMEDRTVRVFNPLDDALSEGSFTYDGAAVSAIRIDFHQESDIRFGLDNLAVLSGNTVDLYKVTLTPGTPLTISTTTPGDGGGEFVNNFNPRLRILDSTGAQVALDDDSAPDGRNALLTYNPVTGGTYYIEVSSSTAASTIGEYVLDVQGASTALPAFQVASITPANGSVSRTSLTTVTVVFNDGVYLPSLSASDLLIDGVASATSVSQTNATTFVFTIPSIASGTHTLSFAAGAVVDLQQTPLAAFSSTFTIDVTPPRVIATSLAPNGVIAAGALSYQITFDEAMKVANLSADDFTLRGNVLAVNYTASSFSFDGTGTVLTLNYANLPEDTYTLTLVAGATGGANFTDVAGNALDGEFSGAFPSGNGTAGGSFVIGFSADRATTALPDLVGAAPAGSLVYSSTSSTLISSTTDTDSFTLYVDAGQTISVAIVPTGSWLPTVTLVAPNNSVLATASAALAGQEVDLQTVAAAAPGIYTITIGSTGGTVGLATVQATLNATLETESHGGTSNDALATAQDIDSAFTSLGGSASRAAVSAVSEPDAGSLANELEPNNTTATANNAVGNFVAFSGNIYHLGLTGSISTTSDIDYFKIGALNVGDIITVSGSGSGGARGTLGDTYVYLYRGSASAPVLVTSNDDSGTGLDSLIYRFSITTADTYYIAAAPYSSSYTGTYGLGVYLEDTGAAPITGGSVTSETESNNTAATANDVSTSWRSAQYLSRTAGTLSATTDVDIYRYTLTAGDLISVNIHSTSTVKPKVSLLNAAGTVIAIEDGTSSGPGNDSPLYAYRITTSGSYFVQVSDYSGTGAYNADVYLSTSTPPPPPTSNQDWYKLTLAAGDKITLGVKGLTSSAGLLELKNSAGTTLASGAVGAGNLDAVINGFAISTAGTYYVRFSGGSGNYNLIATKNAVFGNKTNASRATAQPIPTSGVVLGAVTAAVGDYYSLSLNAGDSLQVATATPGGSPAQGSNNLDPKIELYDSNGVLVASDDNSVADGRNARLGYVAQTTGSYVVRVFGGGTGDYTLTTGLLPAAQVQSRLIFYNNSSFDGNDAAANAADDGAIATDKSVLLPGGAASFANYTSYSRGLNGLVIDIANLRGTPTAADFTFLVGNNNTPSTWTAAPAPLSISVRPGAGINGSDRITIIWADNAIQNQWLQVTVKATAVTGLATADVFYVGNAIGETGNTTGNAFVNATDEIASRNNTASSVPVYSVYDFDRNGIVDSNDEAIARSHRTTFVDALQLITP